MSTCDLDIWAPITLSRNMVNGLEREIYPTCTLGWNESCSTQQIKKGAYIFSIKF